MLRTLQEQLHLQMKFRGSLGLDQLLQDICRLPSSHMYLPRR